MDHCYMSEYMRKVLNTSRKPMYHNRTWLRIMNKLFMDNGNFTFNICIKLLYIIGDTGNLGHFLNLVANI